jgi:hypothetical protein
VKEQPIYDAVVFDLDFDPSTLTRFDFDAFLAASRKVRKVTKPRKAARRARRS